MQTNAGPAANNPIYMIKKLGKRKFRKIPRCIYFYYLGPDGTGSYETRHYYYTYEDEEIEPEDLPAKIIELARNARLPEDDQSPPPDGADGNYIVWTRKSYLVFLMDVPNAEFDVDNGIEITAKDGSPNYSFFDGIQFKVTLPVHPNGTTNAAVAYCINHMKRDQNGNDLKREAPRFRIKLNTNLEKIGLKDALRKLRFRKRVDDQGTNMGPPVPPP